MGLRKQQEDVVGLENSKLQFSVMSLAHSLAQNQRRISICFGMVFIRRKEHSGSSLRICSFKPCIFFLFPEGGLHFYNYLFIILLVWMIDAVDMYIKEEDII